MVFKKKGYDCTVQIGCQTSSDAHNIQNRDLCVKYPHKTCEKICVEFNSTLKIKKILKPQDRQ